MTTSVRGGRRAKRWMLAGVFSVLLASQMATGVPLASVDHEERGAGREQQSQLLQDYLSALVNQQSHKQDRASGYDSVHPLNRRSGWGGAQASSTGGFKGPHRRQAVATSLPNVLPATDDQSATPASAASASASTAPAASASSASLPDVTPVSSSASPSKSSASSKPSSTQSNDADSHSSGVSDFFSPHNKLFPLAVAVCVAIGIGSLLILISLAKLISHSKMSAEEKAGAYEDYRPKKGGKGGATATAAVRGARSLKRAFTSKKLGSFARRNQEGSVLIDVGDEVYAVTPEVAREYERERSSMGGSSGGSRLTTSSNNASPLRQALKNAEMIVAANSATVHPNNRPVPKGFDIHSWRAASALPGIDKDKRDDYGDDDERGLARSISQRLTDGFRALRGRGNNGEDRMKRGDAAGAFSFDSEKQEMGGMRQAEVPPSAYMPVITRGAKEWDISPQRETKQDLPPLKSKRGEPSLGEADKLSHQRHTLTDGPVSRSKTIRTSIDIPGSFPERRPKSILVKRDEQGGNYRHRTPAPAAQTDNVLPYSKAQPSKSKELSRQKTVSKSTRLAKHRNASSTSFASPRMLQQRTSPIVGSGAVFMKPADPYATKATETHAPHTRELFRPLPMPPAFSPLTGNI